VRENVRTTAICARNIAGYRALSWREWANLFVHLAKIKISLLATLSAAAGYILATGMITTHMLAPTVAVFLLACGSCALNQYQEREIDKLMDRTKSRPIPSGTLNPETAFSFSLGLILLGLVILLHGAHKMAFSLGFFAVAWYNGVYTYLKQQTAFAAIPGALVGATPPALGWLLGGGSLFDHRIWGVIFFFFIWQVPHFWLLLLDFSKDYESAGLPSITKVFSTKQIKRIIFIWLLATGVSSVIIPIFGLLNYPFFYFPLVAAASWLFWNAIIFLRSHDNKDLLRSTFMRLNIYALLVISLFSVDRLLS
jgi:protoheme IX farnesyltransferase